MRRLVSALAICVAVGGASGQIARAAPGDCDPAVRVSGDRRIADLIRASLAGRGLADDATDQCPLIHARVERRGDRLRVEVIDGHGRRSQREVRDTGTAIALIESWVRPEVALDDLPGAAPPPRPPEIRIEAVAAESPALRSPAIAAAPIGIAATTGIAPAATGIAPAATGIAPAATGIAFAAGAVSSDDGATWMRVDASGCRAIGRLCLGARIAVARDLRVGDSNHSRTSASAGVLTEAPWPIRRFAVVPGVGLAIGWDRVGELGPHLDQHDNLASLRAAANVAVRAAIARRWSVAIELGGDVVVLGGNALLPGARGHASVGLRYGGR